MDRAYTDPMIEALYQLVPETGWWTGTAKDIYAQLPDEDDVPFKVSWSAVHVGIALADLQLWQPDDDRWEERRPLEIRKQRGRRGTRYAARYA